MIHNVNVYVGIVGHRGMYGHTQNNNVHLDLYGVKNAIFDTH